MGSLNHNLAMAKIAVRHVENKMTIGASNKIGDILSSLYGSVLCVMATRSVEIATPANDNVPRFIRQMAAKAGHVGCGNCGEQAAVAFVYLLENGICPLDFMARTNADHAFVVIGRKAGSVDNDPASWGETAVVCDPWHEKAYPAIEIKSKMFGGGKLAPDSWHRHE